MYKKIITLVVPVLLALMSVQAQNKELVVVHTNDTHSQIEPYTYKADTNVGGFLRRDAYIREVRAKHPNLLLVDAGDYSQGTPYFNMFNGYTEVYLMNAMGYDAATLGNHEFDKGCPALAKRLKKAKYVTVCANYDFKNKNLNKVVKKYTIVEKNGLKIGIFGLTVDVSALIAPSTSKGVIYHDPVNAAQEMVSVLKDQNCDLIICLSHLGVDQDMVNDFTVAEAVPGIDMIIGGHSHKEFAEPKMVGNTRIYQMTNKGKCLGVITLEY